MSSRFSPDEDIIMQFVFDCESFCAARIPAATQLELKHGARSAYH